MQHRRGLHERETFHDLVRVTVENCVAPALLHRTPKSFRQSETVALNHFRRAAQRDAAPRAIETTAEHHLVRSLAIGAIEQIRISTNHPAAARSTLGEKPLLLRSVVR